MSGRQIGRIIGVIVICMFGLVGLAIDVTVIRSELTAAEVRRWPATTGTIVRMELKAVKKQRGFSYSVEGEYEYHVDGDRFTSDRISSGRQLPGDFVAEHQPGTSVTVRYDPSDPARAWVNHSGLISNSRLIQTLAAGVLLLGFNGATVFSVVAVTGLVRELRSPR